MCTPTQFSRATIKQVQLKLLPLLHFSAQQWPLTVTDKASVFDRALNPSQWNWASYVLFCSWFPSFLSSLSSAFISSSLSFLSNPLFSFLYWMSLLSSLGCLCVKSPALIQNSTTGWIHRLILCACMPAFVCTGGLWGNFMIEKMESKGDVHGNLLCDLLPGCLTKRVVFGQGGHCKALSRLSTGSHWSAKSNDSLAAQNAAHMHIHADVTAVCVNGRTCRHWLIKVITVHKLNEYNWPGIFKLSCSFEDCS